MVPATQKRSREEQDVRPLTPRDRLPRLHGGKGGKGSGSVHYAVSSASDKVLLPPLLAAAQGTRPARTPPQGAAVPASTSGREDTRSGASVFKLKVLRVVWTKRAGISTITTGAGTPPPKKTRDTYAHALAHAHAHFLLHPHVLAHAHACVLAHAHTPSLACARAHAHRRALMALRALLPRGSGPDRGYGSETSGNLTPTPRETPGSQGEWLQGHP